MNDFPLAFESEETGPSHRTTALSAPGAFRRWFATCGVALSLCFLVTPALAAPITSGLVGYWPGEGNGLDSSINTNDLTLQAGAGFGSGVSGQAFSFDGSDDLASALSTSGLPSGSSDRTIAFWMKSPRTLRIWRISFVSARPRSRRLTC